MNINWKILDKKEIEQELLKIISDDEKFNKILVDRNGSKNIYCLTPDEFEAFAKIDIASTCFSEDEAKDLAAVILENNLDKMDYQGLLQYISTLPEEEQTQYNQYIRIFIKNR